MAHITSPILPQTLIPIITHTLKLKTHTVSNQTSSRMANSSISASFVESQCVIQPRRLKDFLQDQKLPLNRPRKSTISFFIHAAVSSVKSSSILRRSISRRFSKSTRINKNRSSGGSVEATMARSTSVTVKDILRWKSFRDLADLEENNVPRPSDFTVESPSRCTTNTTTTTATTTSAGTPRSSWCDSDFTVGDSPVWCCGFSGEIDVTEKKNFHINVAGDRIRQNTSDPKDRIIHEEEDDEQFSPISVLDFAQEHEEAFSSFHQILAKMDRRNFILKQQIQEFENLIEVEDHSLVSKNIELDDVESFIIEEKAIELMNQVKTTTSIQEFDSNMDYLLLDFFRDELLTKNGLETDSEFESRVLQVSKSWITTESDETLEWEIEGAREMCVREIEKMINLKEFKDDKHEIGIEIASMMFDHLLDELSSDLVNV